MKRRIVILSLTLLVAIAIAGGYWWNRDRAARSYYTDGERIARPVDEAFVREVLWQPPTPMPSHVNGESDEYEPRISADGSTLVFVRGKAGANADLWMSQRDGSRPNGWKEPQPLLDLNSDHDELGPTLSSDGRTLLFASDRPGGLGGSDVWLSHKGDFGWSQPINLGPEINSEYNEYGPSLSRDADQLLFASNRPAAGETPTRKPGDWSATVRERYAASDYDLYRAIAKPDGYEPATAIADMNSRSNEGAPAFSPAGDFLYFCSDRAGGRGGFDLYRARILDGRTLEPEALSDDVNTSANEMDPAPDSGGFALVFSSDRPSASAERAPADIADYDLWRAESREVFVRVGPREPIDFAALWALIGPLLMWLLLLLLGLLMLLASWKGVRSQRLGLLARCLLASLIAHIMIMILLTFWQVTTSIAQIVQKGSAVRIVLAGSSGGGGLAGQLRGGVSGDLNVAPRETPAAIKAERVEQSPGAEAEIIDLGMNRANVGAEEAARLQAAARDSNDGRVESPGTADAVMVVAQQSANADVTSPQDARRETSAESATVAPTNGQATAIARSQSATPAASSEASQVHVRTNAAQTGEVEQVQIAAVTPAEASAASGTNAATALPQSQEATTVEALTPGAVTLGQPDDASEARVAAGESSGPQGPATTGGGAAGAIARASADVGGAAAAGSSDGRTVIVNPGANTNERATSDGPMAVASAVPIDSTASASSDGATGIATARSVAEIGDAAGGQVAALATPGDSAAIAGGDGAAETGATVTAANAATGGASRSIAGTSVAVSGDDLDGASVALSTGVADAGGSAERVSVGDARTAKDSTSRGTTGQSSGAPSSDLALSTDAADGVGGKNASTLALPTEVAGSAGGEGDAERGAEVTAADASSEGSGRAAVATSVTAAGETDATGGMVATSAAIGGAGAAETLTAGDVRVFSDSESRSAGAMQDAAAPTSASDLDAALAGSGGGGTRDIALPSDGAGAMASGDEAATRPDAGGPASALASNSGRRESDAAGGSDVFGGDEAGMIAMAPSSAAGGMSREASASLNSTVTDASGAGASKSGNGASPGSDWALGLDDDALGTPAMAAAAQLNLPGGGDGVAAGHDDDENDMRGPSASVAGSSAARAAGTGESTFVGSVGASSIALDPLRDSQSGGEGSDRLDSSTTNVTGAIADADTVSGSTSAPIAAALTDALLPEAAPGMDIGLKLPTDISAPANPYAARAEDTRLDTVMRMGGSEETEAAVAVALEWLARHQSADGRWAARAFDEDCGECEGEGKFDTDIATTGLALLCFLGADHTHNKEGKYRANVVRGLQWLVQQQLPDGDLRGGETMYSHGIASIAMAESLGMTKDARLQEPVRLAIDFIAKALNRNEGGWRYEPGQAGDTSVAGWQVMAMMSAKRAGLETPDEAFAAASAWMDKVMVPNRPGQYAYQPGQPHSPSMTAEGLFIQQLLGVPRDDPRMKGSVDVIMANLPRWDDAASTYYWYYATLAMFQHQGPEWERWNKELTRVLLANQRKSGAASGSWDLNDNWSQIGGRVYQTAICTLCLEVYYRYLPMYRSPQLAAARSAVRGVVTDASTGQPIAGAMVKLDMSIGSGVLIASTDSEGRYALALPELPADFVAISASREGYVPLTVNIARDEAERAGVIRDFALEPKRSNIIALEDQPQVHHLGNDEFEGAINSQFQKAAEGTSFRDSFTLTRQHLPPNIRTAEVVVMVKGAQAQNSIFVNDQRLRVRMDIAPRDGSFGEFRVAIPLDWLREGENSIVIRSSSSEGDLDDFEFTNVQIQFDAEGATRDAEDE